MTVGLEEVKDDKEAREPNWGTKNKLCNHLLLSNIMLISHT